MDDKKKYTIPEAEIVELPDIDTLVESSEAGLNDGEVLEQYEKEVFVSYYSCFNGFVFMRAYGKPG